MSVHFVKSLSDQIQAFKKLWEAFEHSDTELLDFCCYFQIGRYNLSYINLFFCS